MSDGALSRPRLDRMASALRAPVERGEVAGLVALVARRDTLHAEAIGVQDIAARTPMRRDTIFRIASMTKAVLAAAAMILVEETRLRLDDPVDPWLPELADRKVLRALDGPVEDTVPAQRPVTLRDLLTMRFGLGVIMAPPASIRSSRRCRKPGSRPAPIPSLHRRGVYAAARFAAACAPARRALALPHRL